MLPTETLSHPQPGTSPVARIRVAELAEVPEGGHASFWTEEGMVALFRLAGGVYAIDDICPHMNESLASGSEEAGIVSCPAHGWRFDVRTGRSPDFEGLKVTRYPVEVENGIVYVKIDDSAGSGLLDDAYIDREDEPDPDDIDDPPFD